MVKILIKHVNCVEKADAICIEICPAQVFMVEETTGRPVVANEEDCMLCRACEFNCPGQAIKIEP